MDEELVRQRFETALAEHKWEFGEFFLLRFFGLTVSYGDQTCRVEIPTAEYMGNPQGSLHGGVLSLAMDVSMGHLCQRFLGQAVTLSMSTEYLRAVRGPVVCEARFLKPGRRLVFLESRVTDEHGELAAMATANWMRSEA